MSAILFAMLLAADASAGVGETSDKLNSCVFSKADQFSVARESAEVVVNAALAACLTERAELRTAMRKSTKQTGPSLSKEAEKESYDLIVGAVRDEALVRVVTARAKNAQD